MRAGGKDPGKAHGSRRQGIRGLIEDIVCELCRGDITKAEAVKWKTTIAQAGRYMDYRVTEIERSMLPAKAMMAAMGIKVEGSSGASGCTDRKQAECEELYGDNLTWACQNCRLKAKK